jgi:hypothetical protein
MASLADTQAPDYTVGRDIAIMSSIPGLGCVVAATLVAEACEAIRERDYYALRAHGRDRYAPARDASRSHAGDATNPIEHQFRERQNLVIGSIARRGQLDFNVTK